MSKDIDNCLDKCYKLHTHANPKELTECNSKCFITASCYKKCFIKSRSNSAPTDLFECHNKCVYDHKNFVNGYDVLKHMKF